MTEIVCGLINYLILFFLGIHYLSIDSIVRRGAVTLSFGTWVDMDIYELIDISPFSWDAIGIALLCGMLVGFERQLRGKPVGIRTASLISLGTYLFTAAAVSVNTVESDPSRIIGQVVTGVGFLGAGVMLSKDGMVIGVTSAATIWVLAAIGVVVAVASPMTAIKLSLLVIVILHGVELLETYSSALTRGVHSRYRHWRGSSNQSEE